MADTDWEPKDGTSRRYRPSSRFVVTLSILFLTFLLFEFGVVTIYLELIVKRNLIVSTSVVATVVLCTWIMTLWSYLACWLTDPGGVPGYWDEMVKERGYPTSREVHQWAVGVSQYCVQCQTYRPERARHCALCGRCILRMDHHCQFLGTCIGIKNLKSFLLFWFWLFLTTMAMSACSLVVSGSSLPDLNTLENLPANELTTYKTRLPVYLTGIAFGLVDGFIAIVSFCCFVIHLILIIRNCSSIEQSYPGKNPYDNGTRENMQLILGKPSWRWLFPVPICPQPKTYGLVYTVGKQKTSTLPGVDTTAVTHASQESLETLPFLSEV